jgi:hypothetical protein
MLNTDSARDGETAVVEGAPLRRMHCNCCAAQVMACGRSSVSLAANSLLRLSVTGGLGKVIDKSGYSTPSAVLFTRGHSDAVALTAVDLHGCPVTEGLLRGAP